MKNEIDISIKIRYVPLMGTMHVRHQSIQELQNGLEQLLKYELDIMHQYHQSVSRSDRH